MTKKTLIITITATLAAIAVGAGVLVGCSGNDTASVPSGGSTVPATTDTQTSAPSRDAAPLDAAPAAGATLATEDDIAAATDAGLGVYTTTSGAKVAIDKAAPLPAEIVADIRAGVGSMAAAPADKAAMEAQSNVRTSIYSTASAAGKTVVFVMAAGRYGQENTLEESWFSIGTTDRNIVAPGAKFGSAAEALAAAQAAVAAQADPSIYEIIDLTA